MRAVTPETADAADGIVTSLEIGYRSTYHAENLEPSAEYVFRVAACNGEGQGAWSPWSEVFQCAQPKSAARRAPPGGAARKTARGSALFPGAGASRDKLE